jgi:hypothetical protein
MKVIAAPGLKVPKENNPREYITEGEAQEVEVTAYYVRRLADNELVEIVGVADEQARPTELASQANQSMRADKASKAATAA